jgi:protein-disulfide isomerase
MFMKRTLIFVVITLTLAACTNTTGLSEQSSRGPKGNPQAAVTVMEFADLQCPACQTAHAQITAPLLEKYGTQIRFTFKHFPLRSIHRYALEAAMASECAADQGKFWEYVDMVYSEQKKLDVDQLSVWAKNLGLDLGIFDRCMNSKIKRSTVLADYDEGQKLGVTGTPSYFVNGKKIESGVDTLSKAIEEALGGMMQRL